MNRRLRLLWLLVPVLAMSCTIQTSKQDPNKAARSAVEFAKAALIVRDLNAAYALLDPEAQSNTPKEQFTQIIQKMVSDKAPTAVSATEFEPIAGEAMMNIYLVGDYNGEKLHYRVPMRGNSDQGYKPVGLLRGNYPPSDSRQPLQNPPSSGG